MEEKYASRPHGAAGAKVISVIQVEISRGKGTKQDMCRIVKQYWSLEGELLAEFDPELD